MDSKRAFFPFTCQLHENLNIHALSDVEIFSPSKNTKFTVECDSFINFSQKQKKLFGKKLFFIKKNDHFPTGKDCDSAVELE